MKHLATLLGLIMFAGLVHAQSAPRMRPVIGAPAAAAPAPAPGVASLPKDYEALYQKEVEKTRQLNAEVQTLSARIAEMTRPGGSLVQAYCESGTISRNTAGAQNDCSAAGFTCEAVSGLCRTTAGTSAHCAVGFTYCAIRSSCVRTAEECQ